MDYAIKATGIDKSYGTLRALASLDLNVPRGQVFALLGPNGAGKTTFMKILMGFCRPDFGSVEILGKKMDTDLKRKIGYLPERVFVHSFLTALEFLEMQGRFYQMKGSGLRQHCISMLNLVGLAGKENVRCSTFSKGMTQRLGLAQAVMNQPELLLLDEPGSGLDPAGIIEMRELLLSIKKQFQTTIFINSHRLLEVEKLCSSIAVLNRGKLAASGEMTALTQEKNEVELILFQPNSSVTGFIQSISDSFSEEGNRMIFRPKEKDIRNLPAKILELGGEIKKYEVMNENLEELFMRLTKGDKT